MNGGLLIFAALFFGLITGGNLAVILEPFHWYFEAVTAGPVMEAQVCAIEALAGRIP